MTMEGSRRRQAGLGAIAGVLAAGAALGVGQLVAGLTGASGSPVVAVGELQIDFTPPWLKNFAINEFGSDDKLVLVCGILAVLAIFAAVIGVAATRKMAYGMAGIVVFAVVGLGAAATRPTANFPSLLPTLFAAAAAAVVLRILIPLTGPAVAGGAPPVRAARHARRELDVFGVPEAPDLPAPPDLPETGSGTRPPDLAGAGSGTRPPDLPGGAGWTAAGTGAGSGAGTGARSGAVAPAGGGPRRPERRSFLGAGAATVAVAAGAGLAGRVLAERSSVTQARSHLHIPKPQQTVPALPNGVNLDVPGISPFITSNNNFYRVDTAIVLPQVDPSSWQLRIHGMVNREITLSFDELLKRPLLEDYVTLCCVSDPVEGPYIGNALWLGTKLGSLLREAGIQAGADQLLCTSVDGFTSGTPVQTVMDGRDALLAVAMNGQPLPVAHGFPVRMVVPGLYGYVSATKWVTDIEVTKFSQAYAYWAQRGWSQQAPIKTESRIDVPTGTYPLKPGRTAVAGVAWAQHKGIDAVHVRIDQGPWNEATLATVPGIDTWRQWVWYWDATKGNHLIECRATDKTGYTQTAVQEPPEPNGASGYPMIQVSVS
jgi:DMSO/TMAO reductase YedYZ molybdopterin-dependent catalytic subunit